MNCLICGKESADRKGKRFCTYRCHKTYIHLKRCINLTPEEEHLRNQICFLKASSVDNA